MKFIDKSVNKATANTLVGNFLNANWNTVTSAYSGINYNDRVFKDDLKANLKALLISEQSNLCCYCMRHINAHEATLEHIVPKSVTSQVELDRYSHYTIIRDNVVLQSEFESATTIQVCPPSPLSIAYENLTASCDGIIADGLHIKTSKFCNNKRGSAYVEPIFYDPAIEDEVEYKITGLAVPQNVAYLNTFNIVNINYNTLERIRAVWYALSDKEMNDIRSANNLMTRKNILTVSLAPHVEVPKLISLVNDFSTEVFWEALMDYKWFHGYYRQKYFTAIVAPTID